jgi:hypothetical protein
MPNSDAKMLNIEQAGTLFLDLSVNRPRGPNTMADGALLSLVKTPFIDTFLLCPSVDCAVCFATGVTQQENVFYKNILQMGGGGRQ